MALLLALIEGTTSKICINPRSAVQHTSCLISRRFLFSERYIMNPMLKTSHRNISINLQLFMRIRAQQMHKFQSLRHASSKPKLPFEMDAKVKTDTNIYTFSNDRMFRMLTFFGIAQFLFWSNLTIFCYFSLDNYDVDKSKGGDQMEPVPLWGDILEMMAKYRYRLAVGCMLLGYLVGFIAWIFPQRTITKIILLSGGQNVKFSTYKFFGSQRSFTVPLADTNFQHARLAVRQNLSLKIKGHWFYYSIDSKSGHFLNPKLFDNVICVKRDL